MSLRALKGRGNPPLRAQNGNLIKRLRLLRHFAPRDDTGIIAFVLDLILFWCGFDLSDLCFVMSFVGDLILLI
jgi:hypothetical protein